MKFGRSKTKISIFLLIAPSIIYLALCLLYPLFFTAYMSFNSVHLGTQATYKYVGFENYEKVLSMPEFWESLARTIYFMVASVGLELSIGLGIALLLNEEFWGVRFLRGIILLPWAIPMVINGIFWKWIYNGQFGVLNGLLYQLGLIQEYITWLTDPILAFHAIISSEVWKCVPIVAIIMTAALMAIPKDLYDAAKVDGCGALSRFRYVSLPLIRPVMAVVVTIRSIWAFQVFDIVYMLTRGGPLSSTQVLSYYAYRETFQYVDLGEGAAIGYLMLIFVAFFTFVFMKMLYREVHM